MNSSDEERIGNKKDQDVELIYKHFGKKMQC